MMSQEEIEEFLYKYKSTNMIFFNDKDKMKYNRILLENIDLKNRLNKIKEYITTRTPSDIGICGNEPKKYYTLNEDEVDYILELLEEIE